MELGDTSDLGVDGEATPSGQRLGALPWGLSTEWAPIPRAATELQTDTQTHMHRHTHVPTHELSGVNS